MQRLLLTKKFITILKIYHLSFPVWWRKLTFSGYKYEKISVNKLGQRKVTLRCWLFLSDFRRRLT
ncbi:hypothetical protein R7X80_03685, partial [Mesomycoplasma ovipneumoniae]|uniref:hypothetical protein n=1 Tax=Mesomycoplasma ovipneumoniae TaxID=29562 RepID=UPI00296489D8